MMPHDEAQVLEAQTIEQLVLSRLEGDWRVTSLREMVSLEEKDTRQWWLVRCVRLSGRGYRKRRDELFVCERVPRGTLHCYRVMMKRSTR